MPSTAEIGGWLRATVVLAATIGGAAACAAPGDHAARAFPSSWFMRQRLSGNGAIPARARARALQEARARGALVSAPGSWISAGPFNIGGRGTAPGVDPNDGNHPWLGSPQSGAFRSTGGGTGRDP